MMRKMSKIILGIKESSYRRKAPPEKLNSLSAGFSPGQSRDSLIAGGNQACDGNFAFDLTSLSSVRNADYWFFPIKKRERLGCRNQFV
jgi:hypothetical protein